MLISAVLPTFNCSRLLTRAIESVLAQTRPVDDFVVIDDGSTDDTREVVAGYGTAVRYIYQPNGGCAAARNRGIRESRGDWIALIDHDDEWLPAKIETQVAALKTKPDAVVCYTGFYSVGDGSEKVYSPIRPEKLWPAIRVRNLFLPSALMIEKHAFYSVGGFNERLGASCEDWDLNVKLVVRYRSGFVAVEEPLMRYHHHQNNASRRYKSMLESNLSIVEGTLLADLAGISRALWRQRIRSQLFYQAAIGAREAGCSCLNYLVRSFIEWPIPSLELKRFRTLGAELIGRNRVSGV